MSSRVINVLSTKVLKQGQGNKGPWALRSVEATDHDGNPITEKLKTFADLPRGEVTVEVEIQESPEYGRSFLLKPVKASSGGGGRELADLRARVERLEAEVRRLSSLVDVRDPTARPAAPERVAADF